MSDVFFIRQHLIEKSILFALPFLMASLKITPEPEGADGMAGIIL